MIRKHVKVSLYLASYSIPCIIIVIALIGLRITPFGDNTLAISDGNALYINYMGYIVRVLKGQESIIYSFEKGVGGNMMGSWGWFLLNPTFLLFAFFDITDYMAAYTYVSVMNLSICGLTMYILLKDLYGHRLSNLIFSTSYALNGFLVANVFQFNFFTGVMALPIMVLGLKRIFENKNPLVYVLGLAYSLFTNFYFGFMLSVASFIIFLVFLATNRHRYGDARGIIIKYIVSSLLAGGLSSIVWLPALLSLRGGRLDQSIASALTFKENMPFIEIFTKLFTGANNTSELVNGLPNIFVGILPVFLVILFFVSNKVAREKKTTAAILICFYLISFYITVFNIAMHGGTVTNWFNYRDSFVFSFLLLLVAAEEWNNIAAEDTQSVKRALAILMVGTLIVFSRSYEHVTGSEVFIDIAVLALLLLALKMHRQDSIKNPKRVYELVTLLLVCINLFLNYDFSTKKIMEWTNTESEYQQTVLPVSILVDAVNNSNTEFTRMEVTEQRAGNSGNDPMLYGYNGISHSGSDERNFVRASLALLGVQRFDMRTYYTKGITAATDSILGIKYLISKDNLAEEKGYEHIVTVEDWSLYQNPYCLPIAMLSNRDVMNVELDIDDVFANLNASFSAITGIDREVFIEEDSIEFSSYNVFDREVIEQADAKSIVSMQDNSLEESELDGELASLASEGTSASEEIGKNDEVKEGTLGERPKNTNYIKYSWIAKRDGAVYSYNRSGVTEGSSSITPTMNYEGYYHKGDTIVRYLPVEYSVVTEDLLTDVAGRFCVAYADNETLEEMSNAIGKRNTTINRSTDNTIYGSYDAIDGDILLFTIPYDEGWELFFDGNRVDIEETLGAFITADAAPGKHEYEMRFTPSGLRPGIAIAGLSLFGTIIVYIIYRRNSKGDSEKLDQETPLTIDDNQ